MVIEVRTKDHSDLLEKLLPGVMSPSKGRGSSDDEEDEDEDEEDDEDLDDEDLDDEDE